MNKNILILIVFIFMIGFISGYLIKNNFSDRSNPDIIKIDSIYVEKISPPLKQDSLIGKIKIRKDTVIKTQPFLAEIDSIIKNDTINLRYVFPENYFSFDIRRGKDSVIMKTITIEKILTKERTILEEIVFFILGLALGLLGGFIFK